MEWHHTTSTKKNKFKNAPLAGRIMATAFYNEIGVILVNFLPRETMVISHYSTATLRSLNACFYLVSPTWRMSEVLFLHDTQVCAPLTSSKNLYRQCCCTHPIVLTTQSHFHLFSLLKDELWGHHYQTRHWKMPCASSWRKRIFFTGWEYKLVWKWKKIFGKDEEYSTMKNDYAFSNAVVQSCEMFMHLTCTQHEIKNRKQHSERSTYNKCTSGNEQISNE